MFFVPRIRTGAGFTTDRAPVNQAIQRLTGRAPRQESAEDAACRTRQVLRDLGDLVALAQQAAGPVIVVFVSGGMPRGGGGRSGTSRCVVLEPATFRYRVSGTWPSSRSCENVFLCRSAGDVLAHRGRPVSAGRAGTRRRCDRGSIDSLQWARFGHAQSGTERDIGSLRCGRRSRGQCQFSPYPQRHDIQTWGTHHCSAAADYLGESPVALEHVRPSSRALVWLVSAIGCGAAALAVHLVTGPGTFSTRSPAVQPSARNTKVEWLLDRRLTVPRLPYMEWSRWTSWTRPDVRRVSAGRLGD